MRALLRSALKNIAVVLGSKSRIQKTHSSANSSNIIIIKCDQQDRGWFLLALQESVRMNSAAWWNALPKSLHAPFRRVGISFSVWSRLIWHNARGWIFKIKCDQIGSPQTVQVASGYVEITAVVFSSTLHQKPHLRIDVAKRTALKISAPKPNQADHNADRTFSRRDLQEHTAYSRCHVRSHHHVSSPHHHQDDWWHHLL